MRNRFVRTTTALLDEDPRTALVLADISADLFAESAVRHPDRVLNMGIREQLMVSAAGGLAMTGLRPIVHSYATFTVDRVYEQIKLDLNHQGVGAVLVSVGASYDGSGYGYTHFSPADVALLDTLDGWTVLVPGHPDEVETMLRAAAAHDGRVYVRLSTQQNEQPQQTTSRLDPVLKGTAGLDVAVAYTNTPRPFDAAGLRELASPAAKVVLVEPYLAGTSSRLAAEALQGVPHQLLALGVGRADLRRYGSPADHARWHGLDAAGLRASIREFTR
jgi:transketolase